MSNIEEKFVAAHKREAEKTALDMAARAEFKIQVNFHSSRSIHKPLIYSVSVWESGKRLHGGGDTSCSFCWRQRGASAVVPTNEVTMQKSTPQGCKGIIRPQHVSGTLAVCPHCQAKHKVTEIGDTILYSTFVDDCAAILYGYWLKLGGNADIVAQYASGDIRQQTRASGEKLRRSRESKGALSVYPLANILKDTLTGASVEARIRAFITA